MANQENWVAVCWIGGQYDRIVYDVNRRNISTKPPFTIGQVVELKKLKGTRPGQKGEIVRAEKSLVGSSKKASVKNSDKENVARSK